MEFNKEGYLKLVNFFRANKGRVFALYDPKPGTLIQAKGMDRQLLKKLPGLKNKEAFIFHSKHYISNYRLYPDEPIVEFNEEFTQVFIKKSFQECTTITRFISTINPFYAKRKQGE